MEFAIRLVAALIAGGLADWLIGVLLPRKPRARHIVAIALGLAVLIALQLGIPTKSPPSTFQYSVRVRSAPSNAPVQGARVTLDAPSSAPMDEFTDSNGYARFTITKPLSGSSGRLTVEAEGFRSYVQEIDILPGTLPDQVILQPQEPAANRPPTSPNSTPTATPSPSANNASDSVLPPQTPTPLPPLFDDFPVCIDNRLWARTRAATPYPSSMRPYCVELHATPSIPYALVQQGDRVLSVLSPWQDGLTLMQQPDCRFSSVALVIKDIEVSGRAWLGLVVDHPQKSPEVLSIWLGRFAAADDPVKAIANEAHSPLSGAATTHELVPEVHTAGPFILGARFDGQKAHVSISLPQESSSTSFLAAGLPNNFSLSYWVGEDSSLSAVLDAVRVLWVPETCGILDIFPD